MPHIIKPKKIKKTKKLTNLSPKTKAPKSSPVDYYNCLLTYANQGWADAQGTKKKLAACCKECKSQAPKVNEVRQQEIGKLITSYHQVGESLKKLLKPIK